MQKNINRGILVLCLLFCTLTYKAVAAHTNTAKKSIVQKDSSQIKIRQIDSLAIEKYSKQSDFMYKEISPEQQSLWQKFWRWIWDLINRIFSGKSSDSGFVKILFLILKYLIIAATIGTIIFIILKLWGVDLKILTGKSEKVDVPYHETLENIHEINFEDQLDAAIQQSNYRLAVRLLYLRTLKKLSDQELINWLPDKTNKTYVSEIQDPQKSAEFSILTNQFEYIWYGEFHIDKSGFENLQKSFHHFNHKKA
ncbi:DUF4129 domain-containing protein [Pedobacter sp. AW1-32]|uniref:DUF4129 domain-containing protein n=1 Tax=Pedobacter sp. AW1-32 TaxID=3383026 RepID=UPI003FF0F13A